MSVSLRPDWWRRISVSGMSRPVAVFLGQQIAAYHFGESHPFGPQRHAAFVKEFEKQQLRQQVDILEPVSASAGQLALFHSPEYIELVRCASINGQGYLDHGDTPAFVGVYETAAFVVGTTLAAVDQIMSGKYQQVFIPIAGLHHARRNSAAGFCVFNDCGVAIEYLRDRYQIQRIAYVDIDAHHGDGVFYDFIDDAHLCFIDLHEDGRYLYPGTGHADETGEGAALGKKLNIPMPPGANDELFMEKWPQVEKFLTKAQPEFLLLQCGADSLHGDPITHMQYSARAHAHAAARLSDFAHQHCQGRLLAMGGGGYNLDNLAQAWTAVVRSMLQHCVQ